VAAISREDFEDQSSEYIKELQKSFKRDAKRFKTAAQLATPRRLRNAPCFCIQMYDTCLTIVNKFGVSLCTLVFE
jgi:hypothetical protein